MEWKDARRSDNVQDLRGRSFGGGRGGLRVGGMGLGGLVVLMLLTYLVGGDPLALLTQGGPAEVAPQAGQDAPAPAADDEMGQFMRAVLASTEDVWGAVFQQQLNRPYQHPQLNLFSGRVASACGTASAAVGPVYCPGDGDVYIDLTFFRELDRRFGAPGDFAQAYVIAHEVGHHVQNLLGLNERVRQMQQGASEADANQLSVRLELQADCFAGIWGHYVGRQTGPNQVRLNDGDVEEGLRAAAAIGDDTIQRRSQGEVTPETWTHGSSEQRAQWLRRGLQSGLVDRCNTFAAGS
jgi:predicted metalloprotease